MAEMMYEFPLLWNGDARDPVGKLLLTRIDVIEALVNGRYFDENTHLTLSPIQSISSGIMAYSIGVPPAEPAEEKVKDLPPFDPSYICVKCGCFRVDYKYVGKKREGSVFCEDGDIDLECRVAKEHMHRTCMGCGYVLISECIEPDVAETVKVIRGSLNEWP